METMTIDLVLKLPNELKSIKVDFDQRLAFIGPSGCGKSTLVKSLLGLSERGTGTFHFRGRNLMELKIWERRIGYVPQDLILLPHLTVLQNLLYPKSSTRDPLVYDALGINPLLERMPRHLSGGEKQRVALARALTSGAELLILDEPFSSLDRGNKERIVSFVDEYCASRQLPIIFISHEDKEIEQLRCKRIYF